MKKVVFLMLGAIAMAHPIQAFAIYCNGTLLSFSGQRPDPNPIRVYGNTITFANGDSVRMTAHGQYCFQKKGQSCIDIAAGHRGRRGDSIYIDDEQGNNLGSVTLDFINLKISGVNGEYVVMPMNVPAGDQGLVIHGHPGDSQRPSGVVSTHVTQAQLLRRSGTGGGSPSASLSSQVDMSRESRWEGRCNGAQLVSQPAPVRTPNIQDLNDREIYVFQGKRFVVAKVLVTSSEGISAEILAYCRQEVSRFFVNRTFDATI